MSSSSVSINSTQFVQDNVQQLFNNDSLCDIQLAVGSDIIPCHRIILAMSSDYFKTMLFGATEESKERIIAMKLADSKECEYFKLILEFMYTGKVAMSRISLDDAVSLMRMSHVYLIESLVEEFASIIKERFLNKHNVMDMIQLCQVYRVTTLYLACLAIIDRNVGHLIASGEFMSLPSDIFIDIISRDTFQLKECDIFRLIASWLTVNRVPQTVASKLLNSVRCSRITEDEFYRVVKPTNLISESRYLMEQQRCHGKCRRDLLMGSTINVNYAVESMGAMIIAGNEFCRFLLHGFDDLNFPSIDESPRPGPYVMKEEFIEMVSNVAVKKTKKTTVQAVAISFDEPRLINHIYLDLMNEDEGYDYYVSVSINAVNWIPVFEWHCSGKLVIYFKPLDVKYIRITAESQRISVSAIKCMLADRVDYETLSSGIRIRGTSFPSNSKGMLSTEASDYTYHEPGKKIGLRFAQPIMLKSFSLTFPENKCIQRRLMYYIEIDEDVFTAECLDTSRETTKEFDAESGCESDAINIQCINLQEGEEFRCSQFAYQIEFDSFFKRSP